MTVTVLKADESGFLQKDSKCLFSQDVGKAKLNLNLEFKKTEDIWQMSGSCTLANHYHYKYDISPKKLISDKFIYIGSWKLRIDYFGSNINLDPHIPEEKLGLFANRRLVEISVASNGLLIKSDCMTGTIRLL